MKDREHIVNIIMTIGCVVLFFVLWPIVRWLAGVLLVVGLVIFVKALIESKDVKKQIEQDPQKYYDSISKKD